MVIPDLGYKFFHPVFSVKNIVDPDLHQRIKVFLTQEIVSKLSENTIIWYLCSSRIRIFFQSRMQGSKKHLVLYPFATLLDMYRSRISSPVLCGQNTEEQ
jgi:hypothetical protein